MKFIALIASAAAIRLSAPKGLTKAGLGEFKKDMVKAFGHCDTDNSDTLSKEEGIACLEQGGVPKKYWKQIGDALEPYLNKAGELPATAGEEISKDLDNLFDHINANGDGVATEKEARKAGKAAGLPKKEVDAIIKLASHYVWNNTN